MTSATAGRQDSVDRPLRRDAERNRLLILETARRLYAARGLDVGFDEIAREAGIGAATVYRRFPERADLVEVLFEQEIDDVVARLEAAAADPDPWAGLRAFLRWGVEVQAHNQGLAQVLAEAGHGHEKLEQGRRRIEPLADALMLRAQDAGVLRPDVTPLDLIVPMTLLSRVGTSADAALRDRLVTLLLDGFVVSRDAPTPLPLSGPTAAHFADVKFGGRTRA